MDCGEDEAAVISTWLEWNKQGGGGGGWWWWRWGVYKSRLRNRAVNTICHALSPSVSLTASKKKKKKRRKNDALRAALEECGC